MDIALLHKSVEENTTLSFSRAGGKGGQNVNKVNTKVHAQLLPKDIRGLNEEELTQALIRLKNRINAEGFLYVDADEERSQEANRRIALSRLESLIKSAGTLQNKRKKTRPSKAAKEKRLHLKKLRSEIKKKRSWKAEL